MCKTGAAGAITLGVCAAILSCIRPAMSFFAGNAGPADSGAFDQWQPYLLIVIVALLGLAIFIARRPARAAVREPGNVGGRPPFPVWTRRILWVAAALVVVSAFFPYYSGWLMRTVGRGLSWDRHIRQQATARLVLTIEGMDCPVCAAGLQNNLRRIPGVRRAEVRYQDKQASLEYDPDVVEPARFAEVVAQAGFKVGGIVAGID